MCAHASILTAILLLSLASCKKQADQEVEDLRAPIAGTYVGLWSDSKDSLSSSYVDTFFVMLVASDSFRISNQAFHPIYATGPVSDWSWRYQYNTESSTYYVGLPSNYETTYFYFKPDKDSLFYNSRYSAPTSPIHYSGFFKGKKL
jgi:hypothetical protein